MSRCIQHGFILFGSQVKSIHLRGWDSYECDLEILLIHSFNSPLLTHSTFVFKGWSITSWVKVAAVPAGLYTVQNTAALLAYQHLDGVTFNVLNQTKTLSAALCCYLLMGRKQSGAQMLSLLLLLSSALIIENIISIDFISGGRSNNRDVEEVQLSARHFTHGVAPVLFASFISGLAGAISQKNLQSASGCGNSGGRNPYLFSSELCVASLIGLSVSMLFSDDGERISSNGFFDEWTPQTFIPIVANSIGGIVVGLVTKYAGSVRKGFALIFGMLFTGFIQSKMDSNGAISKEQIIGGLIAAFSLWMHATNPYGAAVKSPPQSAFNGKTVSAKRDE